MPEIQKNRNTQICNRLERYCEECARIGSTDCIDHGGRLSEDTSVLGKRLGGDAFGDFRRNWDMDDLFKGPLKPLTKRPNAASSRPFISDRDLLPVPLPTPKLVPPPSKPLSSSVTIPSLTPKPVLQSRSESSSLAIPSPPKISPIRPAASVPASAPAVAAPNTEAVALPNDPNTHSDLCREQGSTDQDNDETNCKEGGVRFRENLGKYVVEYRPPRFKWKLWMGTYATVDEGRRACDCARFYAGQDKGGFYFKDSPALFGELGPLNRPFSLVSKDVKDKAFNVELKKRAKQVIRKVLDAQRAKQPADVTRPTVSKPLSEAIVQSLLGARTNARNDHLPSSSQESPPSSVIADSGHEENELAESTQQEVASAALGACDPFSNLDPFTSTDPLSDTSTLYPEVFSSTAFVPGFNMVPGYPGCIQSSLDFADDIDFPGYVELWNHDLP